MFFQVITQNAMLIRWLNHTSLLLYIFEMPSQVWWVAWRDCWEEVLVWRVVVSLDATLGRVQTRTSSMTNICSKLPRKNIWVRTVLTDNVTSWKRTCLWFPYTDFIMCMLPELNKEALPVRYNLRKAETKRERASAFSFLFSFFVSFLAPLGVNVHRWKEKCS